MIIDIFNKFFSTNNFEAHGVHFMPDHVNLMWLLIYGNGAIALLYFLMPFALLYIYFKRPDFPFRWIFVAIPLFGFWCSATHFLMLLSFWYPYYYLQAFADFGTGIVSFLTLVALIPAAKNTLKLTSPEHLSAENDRLKVEVQTRVENKSLLAEKNNQLRKINQMARVKNSELAELNKKMIDQELQIIELKNNQQKLPT